MTNRIVRIEISDEFLRELLHFPDNIEIIRAEIDNAHYGNIVLTIAGPEFAELYPGDFCPIIKPVYRHHYGDNGEIIQVERLGWGLPGEVLPE